MFQMIPSVSMKQLVSYIPPIFLVTLIKWSFIFIFVMLLLSLLKKLSPGNRHTLWLLLIYGLVLIPILSGFMPYSLFENSKSLSQRGEVVKTFNDLFFLQPISMEAYSVPAVTTAAPVKASVHAPASGYNWPLFMVLIWVAGVFVASFRVIIGRFRLSFLQRDVDMPMIEKYRTQVFQLLGEMGMKKDVCLVTSSRCHIPFTYRFFKPVVVLPGESVAWSADRVRSVLLHELAHIHRHDYLTQSVARIICSLFWYIPFVWIAYSKLCQEQEKACDVSVIEKGIRPVDYASHILDLACFSMRTVAFQGSFLSRGRKKFLERRILHTLSFKKGKNFLKGGQTMRLRNFILLCGILLIAIALIGSCATRKKAISEENFFEAYSGTWINIEYEYSGGMGNPQKVVRYPDGRWEDYSLAMHEMQRCWGKDTITDIWKDSNGDIRYKGSWENSLNVKGYLMGRISDSGNTHEALLRLWGEPIEEWDPDDIRYRYTIHYRQ